MLTRIEIDGFKSFEDFSLDLDPMVVILGTNASGKSNLFDALYFLGHLASTDIRTAARAVRGDTYELFRQTSDGEYQDIIKLAVEVLLEPKVRDPYGSEIELAHTRMRYEVHIRRVRNGRGTERLIVSHEKATPILVKNDRWRPYGKAPGQAFRETRLRSGRRTPWLDVESVDEGIRFKIHQDGSAGRTRLAPQASEATLVSTMATADFPHLFALREELRTWKLLQLDPANLRKASEFLAYDDRLLAIDGVNLAAVMHRIQEETCDEVRQRGVLPALTAEVAAVIPGVLGIEVERVEDAKEYRIKVELRGGIKLPTSVISDGTLRVMALLTLLADPRHRGVLCFEEPENGIHPARLTTLLKRLNRYVTNPHLDEEHRPLSQILMNSHSPVVLSALDEVRACQIHFADVVSVSQKNEPIRYKTRIRPVRYCDGQGKVQDVSKRVTSFEVRRYLSTVDQGA
jgi:predicted ATPase